MATRLAPGQISDLDPYKVMAVIGKRVIHPGGRASAGALLRRAQITASDRVLDVAHAPHGQGRPLLGYIIIAGTKPA